MVFTNFSFLLEREDPALVPACKKLPPSPAIYLSANPADDDDWGMVRATEAPLKPMKPMAVVVPMPPASDSALMPRPMRVRTTPRIKSYSESGPVLEKMARVGLKKVRPNSTGDIEDLRRVAISGFSKNKNGTWMFKVDVGTDEFDSYAVRRRFSDFRELHDGLQELIYPAVLPELPHHGIYSVMQLFFSPEPALSHRAKKLEELLQFVNKHPLLSASAPFANFLGKNPSSPDVGYVSLSCYEAPSLDGSFRLSSSRDSTSSSVSSSTRTRRQSS